MSETHEHFDADGNYTGRTVVTRESEWDDYTRARVMALMAWESKKCPNCGNYDVLVPVENAERNVRWEQHDDRRMRVDVYRCLTCGAVDLMRRDFHEDHKDDKPTPGKNLDADGLIWLAHPLDDEGG